MTAGFALLARTAPDALAARLEAAVGAALGAPVHVVVLAAGDETADPIGAESRLGRIALARAIEAAGRDAAATITWPCPFASVSHTGGVAVAIALARGVPARGLGVDLELDRALRPGLAGVFCDARERAWLDALPAAERDRGVLRLWTAKEALYKADPAQGDAIVAEYAVAVPALDHGGRAGARDTRLCALRLGDASLGVALHPCPEDRHVATTW